MKTHAASVITNIDFYALSHEALCSFLSLEETDLDDEMKLYEAAVTWATTNTTTIPQGEAYAAPSDAEIRSTLGKALFLIRFPAAEVERFAEVCGKSTVLTDTEKSEIYFHGLKGSKIHSGADQRMVAGFSILPRNVNLITVSRYLETGSGWCCAAQTEAIDVRASHDIYLKGISVYGTMNGANISQITINITDLHELNLLSLIKSDVSCDGTEKTVPIMFDKPVRMSRKQTFTISVIIAGTTCYGTSGESSVNQDGVTFTFYNSPKSAINHTTTKEGQIPEILFSKAN